MTKFGFIRSPHDPRDWPLSRIVPTAPTAALPPEIDLSHLVPIRDQGQCGTCVSFAGTGIMDAFQKRAHTIPQGGLSPLFLYARCKAQDGIPDQEGTFPRVALEVMRKEGICPESALPYSKLSQQACLTMPQITEAHMQAALQYKIKAYARIYSLQEIKQALAAGKLVMPGVLVTESFMKPLNGVLPEPSGRILGLHAVYLCGYSDSKKAVRMANSWGASWGDKGFCWIPYDVLEWKADIGMEFMMEAWAVEVEYTPEDKIEMWVDKNTAIVNGVEVQLDVPPTIKDGRVLVPLRFVSEALGRSVHWDNINKKVVITK